MTHFFLLLTLVVGDIEPKLGNYEVSNKFVRLIVFNSTGWEETNKLHDYCTKRIKEITKEWVKTRAPKYKQLKIKIILRKRKVGSSSGSYSNSKTRIHIGKGTDTEDFYDRDRDWETLS